MMHVCVRISNMNKSEIIILFRLDLNKVYDSYDL